MSQPSPEPAAAPARKAGRPKTPAFSRQTVANTVVDLVCERGFAGWSLRELAQRLGVSIGTLTHHFAGREALAIEAMDSVYVLPSDWPGLEGHPPMDRLRRMTEIFVLDSERKRRWWQFWIEYMAVAGRDDVLRQRHEERYGRQRGFFARLLRGTGMREPEAAAARLLAFGNGLAIQQLATPSGMPPARARALLEEYLQQI